MHYLFLGQATRQWQVYAAFVPTLFQAANQAAQTITAEWTTGDERVGALGRLWLSYASGGIIGSLVAGQVAKEETYTLSQF